MAEASEPPKIVTLKILNAKHAGSRWRRWILEQPQWFASDARPRLATQKQDLLTKNK